MSAENSDDSREADPGAPTPADMKRRKVLAESVGTDLSRGERETGADFRDSEDYYQIFSYSPTVVRSLLKRELAAIEWLYVDPGDGRQYREENPEEIPLGKDSLKIEGISASLPIGTLSIKGSARASDRPSDVVSTPERAREAAETFADGGPE